MHDDRGISIEDLKKFVSDADEGDLVSMKATLKEYPNEKERIINFQLPYHPWKSSGVIRVRRETALFMASAHGHLNIVKFLVKNGANVNLFAETMAFDVSLVRAYPMDAAAVSNNLTVLKYLKLYDAGYSGIALNVAAGQGYLEVIKYLIESGCDVNIWHNKYTPLGMAARCNQLEAVKLLLSHGANVDQLDGRGSSPLQYAVTKNHKDMVELLILAGANIGLIREQTGKRAIDLTTNFEIKHMLRFYSYLPNLKKVPSQTFINDYWVYQTVSFKSEVEIATIRALQTESKCPTLVNIVSFWFVKQDGLTKEILKILPTELIDFFNNKAIPKKHIKYVEILEEKEAKENSTSEANVI